MLVVLRLEALQAPDGRRGLADRRDRAEPGAGGNARRGLRQRAGPHRVGDGGVPARALEEQDGSDVGATGPQACGASGPSGERSGTGASWTGWASVDIGPF